MVKVAAFVVARNEEEHLGDTLDSLHSQTQVIDPIVVVDDGSTDHTYVIANRKGCRVVMLPYHADSYVGRPELANVFNAGLDCIMAHFIPDFVIQMGADHILSEDYVESIIERMGESVKMASGSTQLAPLEPDTPWGSGRIIDAKLWYDINGMRYPVKWGYESWLVYKFRMLGYEVKRYDDITSFTRPVRMYPEKANYWGRCSYALGGAIPFAMVKAISMGMDGLHYMKGYFTRSEVEKHEDIAKYVRKQQYERGLAKISGRGWC